MQETSSTGQNIESYCGKCKTSSDHTIMVMDGENVSKVRCSVCGGTHKFRRPADDAGTGKQKAKRNAGAAETAEQVWQAGMAAAKGKAREYSMDSKYRVGDLVDHHRFGKGVVLKVYFNKCGMLFKDGEKLMASTNQ